MQAFLVVAPSIAPYAEYGDAMVQHLLEIKLRHWEASMRDLAAQGLAHLAPCVPEIVTSSAVDYIVPLCTSHNLEVASMLIVFRIT